MDTPSRLLALAPYLLSKVGKAGRRDLAARLVEHGLDLRQVAVLAAVADHGPSSQRDLGTRLAVDPSDMVGAVDALEAAGRVERRRDPADRRRYLVTLTPAGRAALRSATRQADAVTADLLAPLELDERDVLVNLLRKVYGGLK
ncbi:MarR family winged helix-turn-helix transcriptional regulator [Longispora sp. K20-0274]|uniref:MarR family winged helix-turn-helix transcriptional regulator n=1 Tax=Longispora sp. K20-0274 TaxID=3088255 RepID=UPI00399A2899